MPGTSSNDPTIVAEIFNELTSSGFLEQLRLECVADVKTKPSYISLKQRFSELLNKKLSDRDWKMDKAIPRLNIFREQVVECGVLALTIERVVDQVVSWKLREKFVSIIREILCACWDPKYVEQLKLEKFAMENCSYEQLKQVIKKVCDNIHIDWKPVFSNGEIGNCLASFSFSTSLSHQSDEELCLSDESDNSSGISDSEPPTPNVKQETSTPKKNTLKRKELDDNNVEVSRSKRERKTNTKYSSDIYQTNFPKPPIESPTKTSTPVRKTPSPIQKQRSAPITPTNHVKKKLNMDNDKPIKKTEEKPVKETEVKPIKDTEDKPVKEMEDKPIKKTEDKAIKKTEDKPIKKTEDKAIKKTEDKAIKKTEDKPIKKTEDKPIKRTEDKAIKRTEDKAIKSTEDKAIKSTEDKAIKSTEDKPIKGTEDKHIKKTEGKSIRKTEENVTPSKSKVMKAAMKNQELFESKLNQMCQSEEIVYAKKTKVDNLVRKSERRVKRNSLIFWEPGLSQLKIEPFAEEKENTKLQKQSENVEAIARDLEAITPSTRKTPKTESKETDAENERSLKNKSPLTGSASSKRYSDSDLYKPQPVLDSLPKRGRGRPRKIDI